MNLKFAIDEVWVDRLDTPYLITGISSQIKNYPVQASNLINNTTVTYTPLGYDIGTGVESPLDLVTYIGHKDNFPEYFL